MNMIDRLNEIVDKIREHLAAGGGILDDSDHDRMMGIIEEAIADAQWEEDNAKLWKAIQRAERAMQDWNNEEYPSEGDIMSGMFPDGTDDGFCDEN